MKIGFFGGSFNPPHRGHLGVAEAVLATGKVDLIRMVPSYHAPHKGRSEVSFFDRREMLRLMVRHHPGIVVSEVENQLKLSPSYTIKVLDYLSRSEPADEFLLIIGEDSLRDLHLWHQANELVKRYQIITYIRSRNQRLTAADLPDWPPETARRLIQNVICGDFFEISSSEIRNSMAKNPNWCHINREAIDTAVAGYITRHRLYQPDDENERNIMSEKKPEINSSELADFCISSAAEKMGGNLLKINIAETSSIADYFVIATAESAPQLNALNGFIERQVRDKYQLRALSVSGNDASGWILLDLGPVIVHLMTPETRDRYNLEGLWGSSPQQAVDLLDKNKK